MKRVAIILAVVFAAIGGAAAQRGQQPVVEVFKSPTCGCCSKWVDHLRAHGFSVKTTETEAIDDLKAKHQIPQAARSCHTALVGGYVVEGHVPAADVQRLLKEKPAIAGIAVPGMPIGSPGMEVPGMKAQAFDVIAFTRQGTTRVFASH